MRKYLNGGYYTIDLEDGSANRNELLDAINYGKAIMIKFNTQTYFADTIALDEDTQNIIITKGGKTITIDEYGDVDDVGDIQPHLYRNTIEVSDAHINEGDDINIIICFNSDRKFSNIADMLLYLKNISNNYKNLDVRCWNTSSDDVLGFVNYIHQTSNFDYSDNIFTMYDVSSGELSVYFKSTSTFVFENTQIF